LISHTQVATQVPGSYILSARCSRHGCKQEEDNGRRHSPETYLDSELDPPHLKIIPQGFLDLSWLGTC